MKDSVPVDGLSFFRLPCVFTITWLIAAGMTRSRVSQSVSHAENSRRYEF